MNYLRNAFCFLVLLIIGGLLYLNSEDFRQIAKKKVQQELEEKIGYAVAIGDLSFEFPQAILLTDISIVTKEYGPIKAKEATVSFSFAQLLFGKLSSATIYLTDVVTIIPSVIPLPKDIYLYLTWKGEVAELQGEIDILQVSKKKFPYTLLSPLKFKISFPKKETPKFQLLLTTDSKIKMKDQVIDSIELEGVWDPYEKRANLSASVGKISGKDFSLANLSLELSNAGGTLDQWVYNLSLEGNYRDSFQADLAGSFFFSSEGQKSCVVEYCKLTTPEHSLSLKEPLHLFLEDNYFSLLEAHLNFDGREVTLSGHGTQQALDLQLNLPKQPFTYDRVHSLSGDISASLSLQGPLANLRGSLQAHLGSVLVKHPVIDNKFLFHADFSASLQEHAIGFQGALFDHHVKLLEMDGICPVDRLAAYSIKPSVDRPLAIHLSSQIDIGNYSHLMMAPNLWLSGQSELALDVTGLYKQLAIQGNLKFIDGVFERWESGTLLRNINADFDILSDKIILQSLQASDGSKGRVTATGQLDLVSALDFPFHLDLNLVRSTIVDLDDLELVLSGAATFTGDLKGAFLKGELNADLLDIALKEEISSVKHNIEVNYINQGREEVPPTQIVKSDVKWPIQFDLHVKNKKNVLIHGKELSSEWKGDIKVAGSDDQPLLHGDFRVLSGEYLFSGKKFKISDGTITFGGELSKKTSLYVVGEMEVDKIIAQVVLKGPLNDPSLLFRSNPPLSQREIISWIIFGKGMGDITAYEGAELAQSINHLKGSSNSSILTRFKESLGLDRIELRGGEGSASQDLSLEIGKYITPKIFFGLKRSMTSDVNQVGIEANLIKNVKIHGEVGDDKEGQLHLKWKHDY